MRIGKTREQQQRLRQQRRERAAEFAIIGLTHKQIAERLRVAGSTVAALLAEGRQQSHDQVAVTFLLKRHATTSLANGPTKTTGGLYRAHIG